MQILKLQGVYNAIMNNGQAGAGRVVAFPQIRDESKTIQLPLPDELYETWTVLGDSLNTDDPSTTICNGDLIATRVVFERSEIEGRLCVLRLYDSEIAIKRILPSGNSHLRLESNNPDEPPILIEKGDVEVLGIVEYFVRRA